MSNRKVSTDALETLGTIIGKTEKRDAIHIAVLPAEASERLMPGENVGFSAGEASTAITPHTGIVDPFLTKPVLPGEHFWFLLYPRTVTSLRHVWSHPAFAEDSGDDRASHIAWVKEFAEARELTYKRLMDGAHEYLTSGDYITGGSELEGETVPDEFWAHFTAITGRQVSSDERGNFFRCSC